ncbi:hypothetical protein XarbCFBP7408_19860 [Xanthomonas arboricola pv. guizotiae]|uniref:Uncharacterized protein n=1 Tax=Xanthomonas arboricola pv. guizotiae TaxID=487867 RepID=A0A2S6ZR64_9XANT|nr:hypothetical protein XarbCFBP7409_18975 [Xanthomonas arboricola pv. guizotiae]PPU18759.1 hypothetical protein XarbCFBP7408_19860 [Xanthomonas arboricola pv. guizotiae]
MVGTPVQTSRAMTDPHWKPETIAVHGGYRPGPTTRAVAVPIYQTSIRCSVPALDGSDPP